LKMFPLSAEAAPAQEARHKARNSNAPHAPS